MYMYVNKRVELAQHGIALQKIYVFIIIIIIITQICLHNMAVGREVCVCVCVGGGGHIYILYTQYMSTHHKGSMLQ